MLFEGNEALPRERVGRWTRLEHDLFLAGLRDHGKVWKKIAEMIRTRSVVQIRTHAQKYFLKLHRSLRQGGASAAAAVAEDTGSSTRKSTAAEVRMNVLDSDDSISTSPKKPKSNSRKRGASMRTSAPTTRRSLHQARAAVPTRVSSGSQSDSYSEGHDSAEFSSINTLRFANEYEGGEVGELESSEATAEDKARGQYHIQHMESQNAPRMVLPKEDSLESPTSISYMNAGIYYDSEASVDGVLDCGDVAVKIPGVEEGVMGFGDMHPYVFAPNTAFKRQKVDPSASDFSTFNEPDFTGYDNQPRNVGLPIDDFPGVGYHSEMLF